MLSRSFAVYTRLPLPDVAGPGVGAVGLDSRFGEVSLRITVARGECCGGRVRTTGGASRGWRDRAGHGFRQPICYGVEITEYPVVSGPSAGSAEGIGLELVDGQTALK